MRPRKIWRLSFIGVCLYLAAAPLALAHKLLVAAVPGADGTLKVQAFFPDGNPGKEIPVALIPEDGRPPLSGKTDAEGVYSFGSLPPGSYRVEVGDPLGHRAETRVVIPGAAAPVEGRPPPAAAPGAAGPRPAAPPSGGEPLPWVSILAGLGFIFGLTAFLMVLKLRREVRRHASRD